MQAVFTKKYFFKITSIFYHQYRKSLLFLAKHALFYDSDFKKKENDILERRMCVVHKPTRCLCLSSKKRAVKSFSYRFFRSAFL